MDRSDASFHAELVPELRTLVLTGELDMARTDALSEAVGPLVEQPGDVIVDLQGLSFIDSSGLLGLLRIADRVQEGTLILHKPSDPVRRVLDLVELADVSPRIVIVD
jgi:anti-anti-sigma factor